MTQSNPMGPIPALVLGSPAPKADKYKAAWDIINNKAAGAVERAHAKCWLTYRAIDGEITLEDWRNKISHAKIPPFSDETIEFRWESSQHVAEVYLRCLNGLDWLEFAKQITDSPYRLRELPNYCTSFLRILSMIAYDRWVSGDTADAASWAKWTVNHWRETMGSLEIDDEITRWYEVKNDSAPLHVMAVLYAKHHKIRGPFNVTFDEQTRATPWWRCMTKIAKEKTIW